ncbi:MAG: PAS domain-containing protein, partial [Desulfovibrionales bacterium]
MPALPEKIDPESCELLQRAMEAGGVFAFEWDPARDRTLRSESAAEILGLDPELSRESTGKDHFERVHEQDRPAFKAMVEQLHPGQPGYSVTYRFRRPDGEVIWLEESGTALFERDGTMTRLTGVVSDITERRRIEDALQAERAKLGSILNSMHDGVCIISAGHELEYVNPVLERTFGLVAEKKCYAYFHDRDAPCPDCRNPDVLAGQTLRWEWYSPKVHKTYDLLDSPLSNPDGSVSKLEILRDISESKQAEQWLREKERKFRTLAEHTPDVIVRYDRQYIRVYANPALARLTGRPLKEFVGRPVYEPDIPERAELIDRTERALTRVYKTGKETSFESSMTTREGVRWFTNIAVPEREATCRFETVLVVSRDITDYKRLQDKLHRARNVA